jgi:hypothetical protein
MLHGAQRISGEELIQELMTRFGLDAPAARTWIEDRSGSPYDPHRIYEVRWGADEAAMGGKGEGGGRAKVPPHEAWDLG